MSDQSMEEFYQSLKIEREKKEKLYTLERIKCSELGIRYSWIIDMLDDMKMVIKSAKQNNMITGNEKNVLIHYLELELVVRKKLSDFLEKEFYKSQNRLADLKKELEKLDYLSFKVF